jgi:hypothetical protein
MNIYSVLNSSKVNKTGWFRGIEVSAVRSEGDIEEIIRPTGMKTALPHTHTQNRN